MKALRHGAELEALTEPKAHSTESKHMLYRNVCVRVRLQAAAAEEKPAWRVLRDDFMMGATMKDWDKDSDKEEPGTHSGGGVGESDSD